MGVDIKKSKMIVNKIISNKSKNYTVVGECIVPDIKPDVFSIINTSGILNVYKKEIFDGKVRVDGSIETFIMYNSMEGEKSTIRSINHTLDFSQVVTIEEAENNMYEMGNIKILSIESKAINERKINIKVNLIFDMKLQKNCEEEHITNVELRNIQKLESEKNINYIAGIGKTKSNINETINLDNSNKLIEMLKVNTEIRNIDTKISYNKILIKSDVTVKILYKTDNGRYDVVKSDFPIMGFVEIKDISEKNVINTNVEIINSIIKPNGSQDNSVAVDIEVEMNVIAYGSKKISIIKDMYCPNKGLSINRNEITCIKNYNTYMETYNFRQNDIFNIGEEKLYDIDVKLKLEKVTVTNGSILINGNLIFLLIYSINKMTGLQSKIIEIPIKHKINCESIKNNSNIDVRQEIKNENYNVMPGGNIEIGMDIDFFVEYYDNEKIELIDNIEEGNNTANDNYNMVIYYTRDNEDLWEIAKRFGSTKESIVKDNNLENEKIESGTQLFITRQIK